MEKDNFRDLLAQKFLHKPTQAQQKAMHLLEAFVKNPSESIFLLKGFAGTGKTTLISSLVACLDSLKKNAVLIAPTGRAAKVMSIYAMQDAFTIHKKIYYPQSDKGVGVKFALQNNKHKNTIFIVDEASMIPDNPSEAKLFENGSLLNDLISYVYSVKNCSLMLVGDTAQLPPVKMVLSPALDAQHLEMNFNKNIIEIELDEVMRQTKDSGILHNATLMRTNIESFTANDFSFSLDGFKDITRLIDSYEIEDAIVSSYRNYGKEDTAVIVRSNKRANQYNQQIRSKILGYDNELTKGDLLMVVKNNYFWVDANSQASFIANGDVIEIQKVFSVEKLYGFRFAKVNIKMVDYPKQPHFDTVLLLDTIDAETPSLSYEDSDKLYNEIIKDYSTERSKYKRFMKVKNNKYFNALQVKFAYAMTCHKSQGGQWSNIIIEQPYMPNGIDKESLRWLYTALTRAKNKLYLVGFSESMFF